MQIITINREFQRENILLDPISIAAVSDIIKRINNMAHLFACNPSHLVIKHGRFESNVHNIYLVFLILLIHNDRQNLCYNTIGKTNIYPIFPYFYCNSLISIFITFVISANGYNDLHLHLQSLV